MQLIYTPDRILPRVPALGSSAVSILSYSSNYIKLLIPQFGIDAMVL